MRKLIFFVLLLAIISIPILMAPVNAVSDLEYSFVMDRPYTDVVMTLARPDTMNLLANPNGATILYRDLTKINFNLDRIRPAQWHIDGFGVFVIEANVIIPNQVLHFTQDVHGNLNQMVINTALSGPELNLKDYVIRIYLERDENRTRISLHNYINVKVPFAVEALTKLKHSSLQEEVEAINNRNQLAIVQIIRSRPSFISIPIK